MHISTKKEPPPRVSSSFSRLVYAALVPLTFAGGGCDNLVSVCSLPAKHAEIMLALDRS
jgi:hypothetical protein